MQLLQESCLTVSAGYLHKTLHSSQSCSTRWKQGFLSNTSKTQLLCCLRGCAKRPAGDSKHLHRRDTAKVSRRYGTTVFLQTVSGWVHPLSQRAFFQHMWMQWFTEEKLLLHLSIKDIGSVVQELSSLLHQPGMCSCLDIVCVELQLHHEEWIIEVQGV